MTVRTKFICSSKTESPGGQWSIAFVAVTSGSEENKTFWKYTPTGNAAFSTINEAAVKEFVVGKEYYFDITASE